MHYIAEKYLVHEFAKYWYGVFEEYPNPGENQFYFSTTVGRADRSMLLLFINTNTDMVQLYSDDL